MPPVNPRVIPYTVDIRMRWSQFGNLCENVYQAKYPTSVVPTSTALTTLATSFATNTAPYYVALLHESCIFTEVIATDIGTTLGEQGSYTFPTGTHGGTSGDPNAANVACSAILKTGFRGRSRRGRKSYSCFAEGDTSGNTISSTQMGRVIALLASCYNSIGVLYFDWAVGSRKELASYIIRNVVVPDNLVDSQKTRLTGRGT